MIALMSMVLSILANISLQSIIDDESAAVGPPAMVDIQSPITSDTMNE